MQLRVNLVNFILLFNREIGQAIKERSQEVRRQVKEYKESRMPDELADANVRHASHVET